MGTQQGAAFVTSRKGFCSLTIKSGRSNFDIMKIRAYTITPQDKRAMRRLYPDMTFDWQKIAQQLAQKREVCRQYRSRRQGARRTARMPREPFYGIVDHATRSVYVNDPGNIAGVGALFDALIRQEAIMPHGDEE